mmetsp:Transcript_23769/g.42525  ORF Transcript_23769/g.42525 Transcript_23769/m.42525 type:complete len:273 (-) Transcript_23769:113-931(-)
MKNSDDVVLDRIALIETHAHVLTTITTDFDCSPEQKLAFWRASKENVAVAEQRLQETDAWRTSFGIEALMQNDEWLARERAFRSVLMYDYLGTDRHGRPVMVERVGAWNVSAVLTAAANDENDNNDAFLKLHCMACETLLHMDRPPCTVDGRGQVVIMDCAGLSVKHLSPTLAKAFGRLSSNDERHYPDTVAHIFVVNAPYVFKALSILITPFMDKDTLSKVHVSSGIPHELVDFLGADCLPVELGGSRRSLSPYDETARPSVHPVRPDAVG